MPKTRAKKKKSKVPPSSAAEKRVIPLSSARQLLQRSHATLWTHKKVFLAILAIIGVAQAFIVQGIVRTDFASVHNEVQSVFGTRSVSGGFVSYIYLLGSSDQASGAGLAQFCFTVLAVLAIVWALREVASGKVPRVRDAFYKSTTPLIPFVLVSLWGGLQLLPGLTGLWLYSMVVANGIAVHIYEQLLWLAACIALSLISIRWIIGTTFALMIVTLPDIAPLAAIRSARTLVSGRRVKIVGRFLFLSVVLAGAVSILMVPAIIVVPVVVPVLFYCVSLLALVYVVTYTYELYKELLR